MCQHSCADQACSTATPSHAEEWNAKCREARKTMPGRARGIQRGHLVWALPTASGAATSSQKRRAELPWGRHEGEEHVLQSLIWAWNEERELGNPKGAEEGGQHPAQLQQYFMCVLCQTVKTNVASRLLCFPWQISLTSALCVQQWWASVLPQLGKLKCQICFPFPHKPSSH